MRNYFVKVKFENGYGETVYVMKALYCKESEIATRILVIVQDLREKNPLFEDYFYSGYEVMQ